ncbi:glutamate-1-semialdehyde 2,1-aminomutase [Bradyrhizobium japonicum]|uniref:glutamate-1-semialdehyde 2,1-aminomutase n=1 Tax=Bradyrhizobium japonicum TaxID=375 RepID=UPI00216A815D|nr:glutamate-1-semialdehyde 2,1-aminomutase [Bradyrhizobium japonicum]MCS3501756.1 glutamate-1-semialdehyde 2,1-aminomutase [Bradyrhizobium japonicum]MCS3965530.1 glutamate-1-semialdehyde 2,1-aminomutase [Bradyrhizobium japonicum]MCS3997837.1 glutamate-1-semialdehyde 2,1-aminomutase [Bradyrhizobium japonicum]
MNIRSRFFSEANTDNFAKSGALRFRARTAIPGGAHTYAKGDDQYPLLSPGFISRGLGCHVWDLDGNEFIEYGMGLRAVSLGHGFPAVVKAAVEQLSQGTNFTRPSPIEVECAERLIELVPGAEMAKFTKDGSTATTAAIRLARAYTGRDMIALCSDHTFFSYDDWAICTTPMNAGIPRAAARLTQGFRYNDLSSAAELFTRYPGRLAALILEAEKEVPPTMGYLAGLRELCHRNGALLIMDEMITGFRWPACSAQSHHQIEADLSTFGKAMGNGIAISALLGRREIMELGGLDHDRDRVFLLSTTHGAETHALAAALAVMNTYRDEPVIETLHRQGSRLRTGVESATHRHGLTRYFKLAGRTSNLVYACCDRDGVPSQVFRTLFLQETIRRGVLAPSLVTSYSHTNDDIDRTIEAIDSALAVYRKALEDGPEAHLIGRPVAPVFRRRATSTLIKASRTKIRRSSGVKAS